MKIVRMLGVAALVLVLQACGPTYQTIYDFTPPASANGRACVSQCQVSQGHCRNACAATVDACQSRMKLQARQDYEHYAKQQANAGREVRRTPASFESLHACSEYSCRQACEGDFRICYGTCGGSVSGTTICTSGCDK